MMYVLQVQAEQKSSQIGGIHKNKQLLLLKHLPPFTNLLLKTLFIKISNAFQVKARKYKHK